MIGQHLAPQILENEHKIQISLTATRPMMLQSASGDCEWISKQQASLLEKEGMLCDGAYVLSDNGGSNDYNIIYVGGQNIDGSNKLIRS